PAPPATLLWAPLAPPRGGAGAAGRSWRSARFSRRALGFLGGGLAPPPEPPPRFRVRGQSPRSPRNIRAASCWSRRPCAPSPTPPVGRIVYECLAFRVLVNSPG